MARAGTVRVNIDADASGMRRGVGDAERSLSRLNRVGGSALRGLGVAAAGLGAVAGAGLAAGLALGTRELIAQEKASARTANVLETTGGVANVTAKQVEALASAIQAQTGSADDAIQSSANLLLTFTNVRNEAGKNNDVFSQAVPLINDMSVALGTDLNAATLQVGKALNDPIKGMTALSRAGVSFTAQQKEQVKAMQEAGNLQGAQKLILRELRKEFEGAARSEGQTTEALQQIQRKGEDFAESLATNVLPIVVRVMNFISRNWPEIERVTRTAFGGAQRAAQRAMAWFDANVLPTIRAIVTGAKAFWARFGGDITAAFNLARRIVQNAMRAILAIITGVLAVLRGDWSTAWNSLKTVVKSATDSVLAILRGLPGIVFGIASDIGRAIADGVMAGLGNIASRIKSAITFSLPGTGGPSGTVPDQLKGSDALDFALRKVGRGTSTDLQRVTSSGDRAARSARGSAEAAARGAGMDADDIRDAGERAYIGERVRTIQTLSNRIKARRAVLVKALAKSRQTARTPLKGTKEQKQRTLQVRQRARDNVNAYLDELETLAADYADLQVESAELGATLADIDRTNEARDAAAAEDAADATTPGTSISADAQAQIDQATTRATTAERAADIGSSFIRTIFGSSSIEPGQGSVSVTINTLHPGDPAIQGEVARFVASAFGGQGSVPASSFASPA